MLIGSFLFKLDLIRRTAKLYAKLIAITKQKRKVLTAIDQQALLDLSEGLRQVHLGLILFHIFHELPSLRRRCPSESSTTSPRTNGTYRFKVVSKPRDRNKRCRKNPAARGK